jgi:hypothetical protein
MALPSGSQGKPRLAPDECDELVCRHRLGEIVALHFVATLEPQELHLLARLHAFRHDVELEAVAETDDGADDHRVVRIGDKIADEALVDLQSIDWKLLDVVSDE